MKRAARSMILCSTLTALMLTSACTPVNKVKKTLALNDLHIQAGIAEDRGDYQRAYELWTNYVERQPQSVLAEYRLGLVETKLGLYDQAVGHLRVAHDLKPGEVIYIEALAEAYILANRSEPLLDMLHATIHEGEPRSGYYFLAKYSQQVGMMDEAKQTLDTLIALEQAESPEPYIAMANFARTIGNKELEFTNLRYALWFDQSDPILLERVESLGMITGPSLAIQPIPE